MNVPAVTQVVEVDWGLRPVCALQGVQERSEMLILQNHLFAIQHVRYRLSKLLELELPRQLILLHPIKLGRVDVVRHRGAELLHHLLKFGVIRHLRVVHQSRHLRAAHETR